MHETLSGRLQGQARPHRRRHRLQGYGIDPAWARDGCAGRCQERPAGPYFIPADRVPDWRGERVVIVASGPSADEAGVDLARGRAKVIAINESWKLAPFADVVYGCDAKWWRNSGGIPGFGGLKLCHEATACIGVPELYQIAIERHAHRLLTERVGVVGDGGNSGFQANNLAVQFGPPRLIALVGFDLRTDLKKHWHPDHPPGLNNPSAQNMTLWRDRLDRCAPQFEQMGVKVVNCSPISALTAYPKMSIAEALSC